MLTQRPADETPKPSRRDFLKTAWTGTAAAAAFGAFTLSAEEAQAASFDAEYDIVVVGAEVAACRRRSFHAGMATRY